jgi:hypothetical protein
VNPIRPLVLSVAVNYDAAALKPFVQSCRQQVPNCDIVLFAQNLSPATVQWLESENVRVNFSNFTLFNGWAGWRRAYFQLVSALGTGALARWTRLTTGPANDRALQVRRASLHIYSQRYWVYRDFLRAYSGRYSHVLMADSRDVIFQANPFPCAGLHSFGENETIGASHFARRWFQLSYGGGTFRRLAPNAFVCAGVTLGDTPAVLAYLDAMCAESLRVRDYGGVDQAIHNYVLHTGLAPATVHPFGEGCAINLNNIKLSALRVESGRLLNAAGEPYAVVHQYDRVPGLKLRAT